MKYRIVEIRGVFVVQRKLYEIKGVLWWKRKEYLWGAVNIYGSEFVYWEPFDILPPLKTLKKAKERVRVFMKPIVYHEV